MLVGLITPFSDKTAKTGNPVSLRSAALETLFKAGRYLSMDNVCRVSEPCCQRRPERR